MSFLTLLIISFALPLQWKKPVAAFVPPTQVSAAATLTFRQSTTVPTRLASASQSQPPQENSDTDAHDGDGSLSSAIEPHVAFPVISKIAGTEWTGSCRYVNGQLTPNADLELSGGVRYDINGTSITLSSYLTFPNGRTRSVVMRGTRAVPPPKHEVITLEPEGGGPIAMKLSEVRPDTILIDEVERDGGRTVMTSSVSIVLGAAGVELVGVSHEVGDGSGGGAIEGHQIWRMKALPTAVSFDEFDYRNATGW